MLGPGLTWTPVPRVGIGVEVEALVPIVARAMALSGLTVVDKFPVGVRALVGVELRLP